MVTHRNGEQQGDRFFFLWSRSGSFMSLFPGSRLVQMPISLLPDSSIAAIDMKADVAYEPDLNRRAASLSRPTIWSTDAFDSLCLVDLSAP